MRGALAAGEAQSAMRLAAGAGWYWWLGGHKTEGMELLTAATEAPGEVTDEARATVYGLLVQFVSGWAGRRAPGGGVDPRGVPVTARAASSATRRQESSPRWNACCRRRTRS